MGKGGELIGAGVPKPGKKKWVQEQDMQIALETKKGGCQKQGRGQVVGEKESRKRSGREGAE